WAMDHGQQTIVAASDPNIKYGPQGVIEAGEKLDYKVEYENEGEGIAFGVYVTDVLDEDSDDSTLEIGPVYDVETGEQVAPPGTYYPQTRTITWTIGEVGPGQGGYSEFSVNVRDDAPRGTEVINYATVYFPSVPEVTPTNAIVSYIPFEPSIDSINPTSGPVGTLVAIDGEHFGSARSDSYVNFGDTRCSNYAYWSDTKLILLVPEGASGVADVTVTTEVGSSNSKAFAVMPPPSITSVSPTSAYRSDTLKVEITGVSTDFQQGVSNAIFSGKGIMVNSTTVTGAAQVTANITIAHDAPLGPRDVNVITADEIPDPLVGAFTVLDPVPVITSITPSSGEPGTEVRIDGTGFGAKRGDSHVSFGPVMAGEYTYWSENEIRVLVPAGISGEVSITVTTPAGTSNGVSFTAMKSTILTIEGTQPVQYSDTATITAVLTDYEGMPLEGMPVTLDLDTMHDTVLTGPDGSATWRGGVNLSEGTY
ncbi:MAG: IPT/TIG domain-containing protein, partial [Actinomycetia bacterium]|nr:IPT/TIG domain-containing protein [Actinomycetes bacterium]